MGVLASVLFLCLSSFSRADSLAPLSTQEARLVGTGELEVLLGFAYARDVGFPGFSRSAESLLSAPRLGFSVGLGKRVEIQAGYELRRVEDVTGANDETSYGSGDATLATKVLVWNESSVRPAFGLRAETKLPNADDRKGLGTDETDFLFDALLSRDFGPVRLHGNAGLHILGNPRPEGGQDDLFAYSLALLGPSLPVRRAGLRPALELRGLEGSRFGNDLLGGTLALRFEIGRTVVFTGVGVGFSGAAEDWSVSAGVVRKIDLAELFAKEPR